MENTNKNIKTITGAGVLLAITFVLQMLSSLIKIGPFSINLTLIPITLGALLYGPIIGGALGLADAIVILFLPESQALISLNPLGTGTTVILKTLLAGVVAGLLFNALKKKNSLVATIVASVSVPLVNTLTFVVGMTLFNRGFVVANYVTEAMPLPFFALLIAIVGVNFLIEFAVNAGLSTAFHTIIKRFLVKK